MAIITGRHQLSTARSVWKSRYRPTVRPASAYHPRHPTLPSQLREGMVTATTLIGKWHLGWVCQDFGPLKSGYDHFYGYRGGTVGLLPPYRRVRGVPDFWDEDMPISSRRV